MPAADVGACGGSRAVSSRHDSEQQQLTFVLWVVHSASDR